MNQLQIFSDDMFPRDARILIETIFSLEGKVLEGVQLNRITRGTTQGYSRHVPLITVAAQTIREYSNSMNVSSLNKFIEDYVRSGGPIPTAPALEFGAGYQLVYAPVYDFVAAFGERIVQPRWEITLSCRKKGITYSYGKDFGKAISTIDAIRDIFKEEITTLE